MRFLFVLREQLVEVGTSEFKVILDSAQSKRLSKVLRLHTGDDTLVRVLPDGELYDAKISYLNGSKGELRLYPASIRDEYTLRQYPRFELYLGMSIIKKKNFELVVQKVSELGGYSITPLEAGRSDVRLISSFSRECKRLYDITLEACMQSERPVPMVVEESSSPIDFARKVLGEGCRLWVLHEGMDDSSLLDLGHVSEALKDKGRIKIAVMIGPEGGFSQSEIEQLKGIGAKIKRVSGFILRAETAAIMIASVLAIN